jgi:thiol-disulfide isomerase/thioredoxin
MKTKSASFPRTWPVALYILTFFFVAALRVSAEPAAGKFFVAQLAGEWGATVDIGQAEIPFRFEIAEQGMELKGFFFEGDKKIASTSGRYADGRLQFEFEYLNATLTATFNGETLEGLYRYNRKDGKEYPFHATRHSHATATQSPPTKIPQVTGDWQMKLVREDHNPKKDPRTALSWKLYLRQTTTGVSGSILRVDGDTGTLTGGWQGDSLVLSHFAGERPVLLEATLQPDGTLDILLNKRNRYLAARTSDAQAKGIPEPPDPSKFSTVTERNEPFHFSFPDVNGTIVSDADARFKNKVVILAIGGTWCPNCRDEAPFLVNLYRRFHAEGLEIVGLNFEAGGNFAEDEPRIVSFVHEFSIPYPVLYAGAIPDVKDKLPRIANFDSYPTTIYLGRDGRVAGVRAGFAGPATGAANVALQIEVDQLVQRLLGEGLKEHAWK